MAMVLMPVSGNEISELDYRDVTTKLTKGGLFTCSTMMPFVRFNRAQNSGSCSTKKGFISW
jgi:hypothetical protein